MRGEDGTVIIEGLPADDTTSIFFLKIVGGIIRGEGLKPPKPPPARQSHFLIVAQGYFSCGSCVGALNHDD